jgi:hypothetical protein
MGAVPPRSSQLTKLLCRSINSHTPSSTPTLQPTLKRYNADADIPSHPLFADLARFQKQSAFPGGPDPNWLPSQTQKRKHQITFLAFQAKQKEQELEARKMQAKKSRQEVRAKYGW